MPRVTDALVIEPANEYEEVIEPAYEEPVAQIGGIAYAIDQSTLDRIGAEVVNDYDRDKNSRSEWEEKANKALDRASQENMPEKEWPWSGASNVSFPILTVAALQFQARAYPAVVKGDEAVSVKVFGVVPELDPAIAKAAATQVPEGQQPPSEVIAAQQAIQDHERAVMDRQAKVQRAKRVGDYLNYQLFYGMPEWEADTDAMLLALPIVGCAFRKTFVDPDTQRVISRYVPAMNVIVPQSATDLRTTPRITEVMHDVYPYQIKQRIYSGEYLDFQQPVVADDDQCGRMLLEQYRMVDLDGDGLEEPYVVTVDHDTSKVLRIEPGWTDRFPADTSLPAVRFERFQPYTKYGFIPDPKGRFYDIGFGHLLDPITDIVNTIINQLNDAGTAQIAGGGFISGGLRLQGAGQTNVLRWRPGEYKVTNTAPGQLQSSIWERTFPNPSPVAFQMLELMLGAAKDITGVSDVMTGQAPSTAPVGTTMALIEQGLQSFTAIFKRYWRSAKQEYRTLYDMIGAYGNAEDYLEVIDDPQADFATDFNPEGKDVIPVSDPTVSTKMQAMAKGQFLLTQVGQGLNDREIRLRAFRAMDIEDPETLIPIDQPPPGAEEAQAIGKATAEAELEIKKSSATNNLAKAQQAVEQAKKIAEEARQIALETGVASAEIDAIQRGLPGMEQPSYDEMGPRDLAFGG
jgi:chaperonin GroES